MDILNTFCNFIKSFAFRIMLFQLFRRKLVFLFFILGGFFVSCSENESGELRQNPEVYRIELNDAAEVVLDFIRDSVLYIPLETTDSSLIGDWYTIQAVGQNILVSDKQNHCLLHFNKDGDFQNTIGVQGRGPDESMSFLSWKLAEDLVWVFNDHRVLAYDLNGCLERNLAVEFAWADDLMEIAEGFLIYRSKTFPGYTDRLWITDKSFSVQDHLLHSKQNYGHIAYPGVPNLTKVNRTIYVFESYGDTTHIYENGHIVPAIVLDFGSKAFPDDFWEQPIPNTVAVNPIELVKHAAAIKAFFTEINTYFIIAYNNQDFMFIINHHTKKTKLIREIVNLPHVFSFSSIKYITEDDFLVWSIDPLKASTEPMRSFLHKLQCKGNQFVQKESDNPGLLFIKINVF